jgi:hypothetical protein
VRLDLASQLLSQGLIVPLIPANEALKRQPGVAKTIRNRFDVFAFDIRQQTADIDFGLLIGGLPMEDLTKGSIKEYKRGMTCSKISGAT